MSQETAATKPNRDWDGVTAVIAALIGLLALSVSAYTAYLQRQQVRAQVWPLVLLGSSNSKSELVVLNKGVGPAIIRSFKVYVDGKPQRNWDQVFASLGLHFNKRPWFSTVNGTVLSPDDRITQLQFETPEDFNAFATRAERVAFQLCYCSTLDDCWVLDGLERGTTRRFREIDACPVDHPDEFHDNEIDLARTKEKP
ncbi:hypothetical protein IP90_02547 [Luteimonas cucumeris]|uniref:Uncharacterized protein n=1 Tax=Luteimonas cucumeris TaxID=985012 RepID=A0A562KZV1_9GAMM|nr:hypothetical protein [Luteimonas cucumeris]TWI00925.1 hypothetical protein IP90_02547 [Luteimonas cucumeris]